ncbi:MAG: GAF domain-containing protein, partial [Candidatus Sericytochromatia bacterium]|nr:GAF domain-containing protein [Candidatus Tanganyikabacteria bacterium]
MHRANPQGRRRSNPPAWDKLPTGGGFAISALGRGNAAYVTDGHGRIVAWSPEAERLLGLRCDDAVGQPCSEVLGCRDLFGERLEAASCPLRLGALWGAPPPGFEVIAHPPGGAATRLRASSVGLQDPVGGMLVLLQPSPLGLFDGDAGPWAGPDPPGGQPEGNRVGFAIEASLERMVRALGADAIELFLRAPGGADLVLACHCGAAAKAFRERLNFKPGEGYPGIVAQTAHPLVSTDLSADSRFLRKSVYRQGILSCLSVPVIGSQVLGTLQVAFRSSYRSPAPLLPYVTDVARELALQLERARLEAGGALFRGGSDGHGDLDDPAAAAERLLAALVSRAGADGGVLLCENGPDGKLGISAVVGVAAPTRRVLAAGISPARCPAYGGCVRATCGTGHAGDLSCCRQIAREFRSAVCLPISEDEAIGRGLHPVGAALLGFERNLALPTARLTFLHDVV